MRLTLNLSPQQEEALQQSPFPENAFCQHCLAILDGPNCEHEVVEIGLPDESYPVGLAHWLCCHACRDNNDGEDCETFISVPAPVTDRAASQ